MIHKCEVCNSYLAPDVYFKYGKGLFCPTCQLQDERDLKLIVKALRIIQKERHNTLK